MSDKPHSGILKDTALRYDTPLAGVLPPDWAAPLAACGLQTAEDLYECAANCGAGWFRSIPGIDADMATELMNWLGRCGGRVGEVTERFYLPGRSPCLQALSVMTQSSDEGIVPLERLSVPP